MNVIDVSENDRKLLLDFQRASFAFSVFNCEAARTAYLEANENLKQIKEPAIAELVRRMSQEWIHDEVYSRGRLVSRGINKERGEDITLAEKELYELTFQFGDNTIPNETNLIQ